MKRFPALLLALLAVVAFGDVVHFDFVISQVNFATDQVVTARPVIAVNGQSPGSSRLYAPKPVVIVAF